MTEASQTFKSLSVIENQNTQRVPYYCTETEWREYTGFTNQNDFPSDDVKAQLKNATEQIRKDGQHMVRWELATKDTEDRYFTQRRYWGNRYGRDDTAMKINCDQVSAYDIEVWEADITSSVAAALALQGTRLNRLMYKIPYDAILEIDPINGFFKLSDDYPTSGRQIYVTYWVLGKPLDELQYELKRACFEATTMLLLKRLKTRRLKKGTVSYTLGKQTITRDEKTFDEMIKQHYVEYHSWIRWLKPFIGRRVKVGRLETYPERRYTNRY